MVGKQSEKEHFVFKTKIIVNDPNSQWWGWEDAKSHSFNEAPGTYKLEEESHCEINTLLGECLLVTLYMPSIVKSTYALDDVLLIGYMIYDMYFIMLLLTYR